jgi:hypothetical protein
MKATQILILAGIALTVPVGSFAQIAGLTLLGVSVSLTTTLPWEDQRHA